MTDPVIEWILTQKDPLDGVICRAAEKYFEQHKPEPNFQFDIERCSLEMLALSQSGDLCYDRPSIGFCYSLWYHGTRVSVLTSIFNSLLSTFDQQSLTIFDLGAGTGALQWAVALNYCARKSLGLPVPRIRLINVDSSPFMLAYNKDFLWKEFTEVYPHANEIDVEYTVNNWTSQRESASNTWLCASYVFDHSENKEVLASEFAKLVARVQPSTVLLFTSSQSIQQTHMTAVINGLKETGYLDSTTVSPKFYFSGPLQSVDAKRNEWVTKGYAFSGEVIWNRSKFLCNVLVRRQTQIPLPVGALKIYQAPEIVRSKVMLTEEQRKASVPENQPTLIIGPAGCGKSVVLTEKIKNIVERPDKPYDKEVRILLTTFNRKLVNVLGDWLEEILDAKQAKRIRYEKTTRYGTTVLKQHSYFIFTGSSHPNIQVLHFDILPTLVGKVTWKNLSMGNADYYDYHRHLMNQVVDKYFSTKGLSRTDHAKISDPEFLIDEFERIIYGLQIKTRNEYMVVERTGRGNNPTLQFNSHRRKIIYECIHAYLKELKNLGLENFTARRNKLLKKLSDGKVDVKYDHILVDELQDCTRADYQIFQYLLTDPNNLTLACDLAQSIQLGAAFHLPVADEMKKYKRIRLEGSFRLPFRISECLRPLSERISRRYGSREGISAEIIIPYRGAQPGSRPIVVYGTDEKSVAHKIAKVMSSYTDFGLVNYSVFERDTKLKEALLLRGKIVETDIILKSKGLEYTCVVWSSRVLADSKLEQEEFAYTIFTRTSAVLIIAIFDNIDTRLKEIAKVFDSSKSIYWDEETHQVMTQLRGEAAHGEETDDDLSGVLLEEPDEAENLDDLFQ